jgi:3-(3-hydroxy-phenyl)propionate hydroxylase
MSTNRAFALCRNRVIQLLGALPFTRKYLMEMRVKPRAKYRAGFFLWKTTGKSVGKSIQKEGLPVFKDRRKGLVGTLLPQPEVITGDGRRVLLDEVLGSGFALLRRHPNAQKAFATINTDFWERLGTRFVCIQADDAHCELQEPPSLPITIVRAPDKHFPGISEDYFVVVRPDRFVLGIFKEEEADAFVSALQRLLA